MNAVAVAGMAAPMRRMGVACVKCGEGRPAAHLHCYVCGRPLGGAQGRLAWLSRSREWRVWAPVRWALRRMRRPDARAYGMPRPQPRTMGDRVARWYAYLSAAALAFWFFGGASRLTPAAVSAPTEACIWLDTQRLQLTGDAGRLAAEQRDEMAQRLSDLAARLRAGHPAA